MTAPLTILHVEDDPDIRMIAELALQLDPAITVQSAESGGAALAMTTGGHAPDLLLLDVMMPDMDGMTLVTQLRALPALATVPVIFMTARAQPGDIDRYQAAGSLGLIVKPFDPVTLASRVRAMLAEAG